MLQHDKLDILFQLLQEMTQAKRSDTAFAPSKCMRWIENALIATYLLTFLVFISLVTWFRYFPGASAESASRLLVYAYIAILVSIVAYLATVVINAGGVLWRHRHKPLASLLARLRSDLLDDATFLARLWAFDKATLEFSLIEYRQCWNTFDGRLKALMGEFRKVGLFPTLAASSAAAAPLLDQDSSFFLWLPLILVTCFSFVALYALGQRERPDQVIALLEYAIAHTEPEDASNKW